MKKPSQIRSRGGHICRRRMRCSRALRPNEADRVLRLRVWHCSYLNSFMLLRAPVLAVRWVVKPVGLHGPLGFLGEAAYICSAAAPAGCCNGTMNGRRAAMIMSASH
jgi:hypothetical protein